MNYGLRYELPTVIKEENNLFGQFDPSIGIVQVGKQISAPYAGTTKTLRPALASPGMSLAKDAPWSAPVQELFTR